MPFTALGVTSCVLIPLQGKVEMAMLGGVTFVPRGGNVTSNGALQ